MSEKQIKPLKKVRLLFKYKQNDYSIEVIGTDLAIKKAILTYKNSKRNYIFVGVQSLGFVENNYD